MAFRGRSCFARRRNFLECGDLSPLSAFVECNSLKSQSGNRLHSKTSELKGLDYVWFLFKRNFATLIDVKNVAFLLIIFATVRRN